MRIGLVARDESTRGAPLDGYVAAAREAAADGFSTFWVTQALGLDALTVLAVVGREVGGIELGTAVVPVYGRHPMVLATQALTTQHATGGRLVLGVGLSHPSAVETRFGSSFDRPVRHMHDYLGALRPLLRGESVDVDAETVRVRGSVRAGHVVAPPVVVAALGPQMLSLAGRVADGTVTWMTGLRTIATHTVPTIREAAERAGRPEPRVAVGLPVCVTADVPAARESVDRVFRGYGELPSYRAMLDREGVASPSGVAVLGDEDVVRSALQSLAASGATDLVASVVGSPEERAATRALLRSLAARA